MKSVFILLALIYSAPVFADTIKLSCSGYKSVDMTVIGDDVRLKITDKGYYPGGIISGYATVLQSADNYATNYMLHEYNLRKRRGNYSILIGEGSDLKIFSCALGK